MWVCLLFALVISTNCWADPTDVTWDGTSGHEHPSGTTESPASDTKSGITVTTNWSTQSGLCVRTGCTNGNCYNFEYAPADNYIDITTDGKILQTVYVSITNTNNVANVTIAFSSASTYDGNNLESPTSISVINSYSSDGSCEVTAPSNARSARIHGPSAWGPYLHRIRVIAQSEDCPKLTASFSTGTGSGTAPDNIEKCEGASFTMPGKGSMTKAGYALIGWKKDNAGDLIAVGQNYTMPAGGVSFTAQWELIPVVSMPADSVKVHGTDFEVSWVIPGICDLRNYIDPYNNGSKISDQATDDSDVLSYADGIITCAGDAVGCGQHGVAFPIVPTTNVTSITIDCKGNTGFPSTHTIWGGVINSSSTYTYWDYASDLHEYRPADFGTTYNSRRTFDIDTKYWTDYSGNYSTSTSIDYIAVFGNAGCSSPGYNSFSVREARYHVAGRPDIDHVVLMRTKANSDPALTDTTETSVTKRVYSGIKSYYYDEDEKEEGTTYYYTIFAVHADGTLSSRTVVGKSTAEAEKFAVTYDVNGASGDDIPASASYTAGRTFTLPLQGDLHKSGHKFGGWNDGSTTTAAGASYTMPDPGAPVSFTAVWNEFSVPQVTNLAVGEAVDKEVPLSWSIPGICDLSNPVVPKYQNNCTLLTKVYYPEGDSVGVAGNTTADNQFGVAFEIPSTTTNLEWISFEYKGNFASNAHLWAGACDAASGANAYWEFEDNMSVRPTNASEFVQSKQFTPNRAYWGEAWITNPISDRYLSQIAIYGNTSGSGIDGLKYAIRNVRYHCTTFDVDIDHIVLVRKEGSAPENATDGTVYNVGTKSHFVDTDDTKEFGQTYYYSVYAVHADGTLSEATTTSHTVVATATCEVSFNIGEGTIGDAPTSVVKPANGTVTLPSIGTVYKPFYAFTGWKKNNAGDLLSAGSTYTVTAEDVTAETISFTAQWTEDNTTIRIPNTKTFGVSNKPANINTISDVDFNNDGNVDAALDIQNTAAEWSVFIQPGYYEVSMLSAVWRYGMKYTLSLIDPLTDTPVKTFFTKNISRNQNQTQYLNDTVGTFDLTDLIKGKRYVLKIEDTWTGCYLRVHDINFNPVTPEEIASETVLDANNTVTTGLTTATDVDFPGDNDESINLYNKQMDWVVKIAKGYYNISLLYGAPQYSTRVSVALIDPEGVEPTRWFCPDQTDRNGHYHYTSGAAETQYYSIGAGKYNLNNIDPEKTYIVRVHDEYNGSNQLRVKNLTFTLLEPIEIENEVVLNAANSITPNIAMATSVDFTGDSNPDEAMNLRKGGSSPGTNPVEWEVTIARGIYNLALEFGTYSGSGNSLRAKVELIDPSSVESDKVLMTKYVSSTNFASNQYVEIALGACAFTSVTEDKKYIIRVSDNSDPGSYCSLLVRSLTFTPVAPVEIPSVTRLDATNVFDAPGIVDSRIDIKNRQEAVWYANMMPYVYDINLHYTVASGDTKVRFGIIDVESGDTAFVHQQNKYGAGTYTISVPGQNLRSAITAGKMYKIIVKDNYANNGSVPQIDYLEFVHHAETHTRTGLTVGNYGTICLPYAVAAEDRNGAELFEIEEWDPNGASLTLSQLTNNENMVAGRPYIFQATAATATFRYYAEGDEAAAGSNNGLVGSYVQKLILQNDDNYIIYNNKLYLVNSEAYVGANRAYIHKQDQVQPAPAYRRRVTLSVNGAQVATDIDLINDPAQMTKYIENGHLFIFRDGKLYNAQGQLVK